MTASRFKNRVQRTENQRVGASLVGAQTVESGKCKVESLLRFFALLKMTASRFKNRVQRTEYREQRINA